MYGILNILLVLKLTLILLFLTAGGGIVSEQTSSMESPNIDYHLLNYTLLEQNIIDDETIIYQETKTGDAHSDQNGQHKSSLGELRLYIEL